MSIKFDQIIHMLLNWTCQRRWPVELAKDLYSSEMRIKIFLSNLNDCIIISLSTAY